MWKKVTLADVCTLRNGRAYKKPELLSEGKYPVLRVGNFFTSDNWYYSDLELDETKYCDTGDLLYAWSASFGARMWEGEKVIYHYHIWRVDVETEIIDKKFLFYWFEFDKEKIKKESGTGTTMMHVAKGSMEKRELWLPSLAEQQRIVAKLDAAFAEIDTAIDVARAKETEVQKLKASLLSSSFSGDALVCEKAKLGEICNFEGGSQPPKKEFIYEPADGYVRFIQIRDFKSDKNITYIPSPKKNRLCEEDDILIGRYGASVGQILSGLAGAYNVALMKTIPNEEVISKDWLYAYLTSTLFQNPLMEVSSRSAQNGFSKDDIHDFDVPLPPLAEQKLIVAKLDAAFAEIEIAASAVKKKQTNYEALKSAILAQELQSEAA